MQVVYERCCGIDVHKQTVVACVVVPGADGQPLKETRTFGTMTENLAALADWLAELGVTHVTMESTGVYWKPVFNLLDGRFAILVVNAERIKALAGRKTDVQDAEWLADLLRHGLLKGSFIPSEILRALRDLTRYRTKLGDERKSEVNRVQKVLEDANIKLASVASDVMGVSGRAMLNELVQGQTDAATLAELAKGRLREKRSCSKRPLADGCGRIIASCWPSIWRISTSLMRRLPNLIGRLPSRCALLRQPWRHGTRCQALTNGSRRFSSPSLGPTCSPLRMRNIWPPGLACVRGTTRVRANARAGAPAKAVRGCGVR